MEKKHILLLVLLLIAIAGLFGVSQWFAPAVEEEIIEEPVEEDIVVTPPRTITAKHQFVDGVHTVVGEMDIPTPCHVLEHEVSVAEPIPETVTIHFQTRTEAETCIQVIAQARFKVTVEADAEATLEATYNGNPAILNLIEAGPDEDLDDFELFIKG